MIAKLIVWAPDRAQAIARMVRAIQETNVGGVHTGLPAALQVLLHPAFARGEFDTHFLEGLTIQSPEQYSDLVAVAAAIHRHRLARRRALSPKDSARAGWSARTRNELTGHVQRAGSQEVSQ
jgi:acetyl-CoA carboxylase biotin carboxylase subunit